MATDIIIPLGSESKSDNMELRILLRSIDANATNVGTVVVVTDNPPKWLRNVCIVNHGDPHKHNKDANLIDKVIAGCAQLQCKRFVFCADDNVFMKPMNLDQLPVIFNERTMESFAPDFKAGGWGKWCRRMYRTFWLAEEMRRPQRYNFDCHAPQAFDATKIIPMLRMVNYPAGDGYCIYTLFRTLEGVFTGEPQSRWKTTHESKESANNPMDKTFVGYNDDAFTNGLMERLVKHFPNPSRYEGEEVNSSDAPKGPPKQLEFSFAE